jgi:epoxyqueuosine reductase
VSERIEDRLKAKAREFGFELAGIARATDADGFERYREWLDRGYAGEMRYLERNAEPRRHPESILADVRSVLMVGMTYGAERSASSSPLAPREGGEPSRQEPLEAAADGRPAPLSRSERATFESRSPTGASRLRGSIAKYAQAPDYHEYLWARLNPLAEWLDAEMPGSHSRGVTDSAPLLERDFARRAGLGWFGKNTMLIDRRLGSYFFLGALLLDLELQPDPPHATSHCGTCTACLDACPTAAFPQEGVLDSRRCLSYLTIELKGSVPEEFRPAFTDWLFGCDICQEVCPWNRKAPTAREPAFASRPDLVALDPVEILSLSEEEFRRRFRDTALSRTKRRGLVRNALLIVGNRRESRALPALRQLLHDPEPVLREAAAWALERITNPS